MAKRSVARDVVKSGEVVLSERGGGYDEVEVEEGPSAESEARESLLERVVKEVKGRKEIPVGVGVRCPKCGCGRSVMGTSQRLEVEVPGAGKGEDPEKVRVLLRFRRCQGAGCRVNFWAVELEG